MIFKWFLRFPVGFFAPIYLCTYLLFVSYSTHIVYSIHIDIWKKVLLSAFTIPEMESERKISLRFWITFATWFDQFI